jgi:uncharacterized ubiquitin-like protein YukD
LLGDVQAASINLIYSGKILTNEQSLQECQIGEKDFLVLMVTKVSF